ncbi:MAG: hypothetical protein CFH10_00761 [Alphaproteobacteria bacterium MarineAlpha4_Bin2]|nr:MAG: hypothetical protein CFH10_00761 [Alphaproteobacteria bacterium MarineAlpha4_Bin2]
MLSWVLGKRRRKERRKKPKDKRPPYDKAKVILENGNTTERRNLALHEDMEPEILYYLANDTDPIVRREIADNDGTPLQADIILASDPDDGVRKELAHKLGRLLPDISSNQQDKLSKMALDILDILARDQITEVRAIVSDEIKHAGNVPKNVVKRLAMDADTTVFAPVLEYSPLLSDRDLLEIVALGIESGAMGPLASIACREELTEEVVDAIIETGEMNAVPELLKNKSANISENTIDLIAVEAEGREEWHTPLVDRGNLPVHTVKRIASFVSAALFERLIENNDVREEDVDEMRMEVRKRIESDELLGLEDEKARSSAIERAKKLFKEGNLNEKAISEAVDASDIHFMRSAISHMADLPSEVVAKMLSSGSGKAVASLCWKAGMSMRMAVILQRKISKVRPNAMLHPRGGHQFPLTKGDMEWQIEFYGQ